jgi:DNA-binding NarL/FixJ family response regulator
VTLGSPLWAERTRSELGRIGGRRARTGLSPTEGRVAALVAGGLSNKEVAAALFVTPKTVEANLSRIFAKLGVHSRTELAQRLSDERAGRKL